MQIEKITVGKSIERFGSWDRMDIQVSVQPGENPEVIHQEATELLHKLLKINTESGLPVTIVPSPDESVNQRIASLIADINQCTEIDAQNSLGVQIGLISYKEAADSNPEIKAAYDLKMSQLKK